MNLGRLFWTVTRYARAARFWLLLALAALAWLGFSGDASAENCKAIEDGCTRSQAYSAAQSTEEAVAQCNYYWGGPMAPGWTARPVGEPYPSNVGTPWAYYSQSYNWVADNGAQGGCGSRTFYFPEGCPAGQIWNDSAGFKSCMESCTSRASSTFTPRAGTVIPNGAVGCQGGCEFMSASNGDGTFTRFFIGDSEINHCNVTPNECSNNGPGYVLNATLGMCVPTPNECAPNEVKDPHSGQCTQGCPAGMVTDALGMCVPEADHCPAGNVRSPSGECLPGDGQCAAGEARKPDGTCGRDADNDGEPDETDPDEPSSFSGGDSCNAPPSCSGDAIQCGIARISWRIECNTRKDTTVSGGSCGAIPVCTGKNCDALEYSQLLQQWRSACALEKLAQDGIGGGDDEEGPQSCGPGKSDAECAASQNIGDEGDGSSAIVTTEYGADGFDASGFGWASSCPAIPNVTVFGHTLEFQSKIGPLCDWIQLGGVLLMILTGIFCLTMLIKV